MQRKAKKKVDAVPFEISYDGGLITPGAINNLINLLCKIWVIVKGKGQLYA